MFLLLGVSTSIPHYPIWLNSLLVQVLYIDYGNAEILPITRLRRLKTQFTHCPAMAIQCALFEVTPRNGNNWTEAAVESFRQLTADREFEMITKGKTEDCTEVCVTYFMKL